MHDSKLANILFKTCNNKLNDQMHFDKQALSPRPESQADVDVLVLYCI
jgi:hypothetical protein